MTARLLLRLQGAAAIVSFLLVTLSSSLVPARAAISSGRGRGRGCVPSERAALISFKGSFTGPAGRLSSWRGGDCCRWKGVRCDNRTGHVIELDLHGREDCQVVINLDLHGREEYNYYYDEARMQMLRGETMSSSITALHHLRYLDLSFIYFNHTRIPSFLGTLDNLRYRNLSSAHFAGDIPLQLGNLSQLQHLDLRYGSRLNALDLSWLPRLSSLRSLDMSYMDLVSVSDWVHKVNMLPNLKTLFLSNCGLSSTISTLSHSNLTHLEVLDLSNNQFYSSLKHNWF
ncbi:receptor-like protein EIX2 [Panicum virgatum]|uniref:receptor-like protein EIX2 n=1 Tax=Panicum virgatum TaxID=38727 RepID=UPI0019D5C5E3|nr:receptor-like protein EIX2 [Panicum virgatum]